MEQSILKCLIYTKTFISPITLISAPQKNTPFLPSFTQNLDFAEVFWWHPGHDIVLLELLG